MSEAAGSHPLDPVLAPRSVAVVGASADPTKRGFQVLRALDESGYAGRVYPVNPRGGEILGRPVAASLSDLADTPDLALVCTPAAAAPDVVEACGAAGVRGAVILAVGFREAGPRGAALEAEVLARARAGGVRIVGPNTSGILNARLGLDLIGVRGVRPGRLALLVQSGNMALALTTEAKAHRHEGLSVVVGVGNQTDLGFAEYLDWLGRHGETGAVLVYAEGFRDARAFLAAAARVGRRCPVLLVKGGRTERGRAAAHGHTGAVAGPYDRLAAGLAQAGVVELRRTDELFHVGRTLASQPPCPDGTGGIAILSDGGGQGTLAADALTEAGIPLAVTSDGTRAALRELLGAAAAVGNPADLAGAADADPGVFAEALALVAADPRVGGVLLVGLFGGYGVRFAESLTTAETAAARAMADTMRSSGRPFVVHTMYAGHETAPLDTLEAAGVPTIGSLETACRAIGECWRRGRMLAEPPWDPGATGLDAPGSRAPRGALRLLTEPGARALLEPRGVRFPETVLCATREEAAGAAGRLGGPVALKVVSDAVAHKTDAGGVALGVEGPEEAARAFDRIVERSRAWIRARELAPRIAGVSVTPMQRPPLAELLVGAVRDPDLGPVLTVGAGGTWVEAVRDVAHRVLPVRAADVRAMLASLRVHPLLAGARGRPAGDVEGVVRVARALAALVLEDRSVVEAEVNPLFVYADGVVAVDVRVYRAGREDAGDRPDAPGAAPPDAEVPGRE